MYQQKIPRMSPAGQEIKSVQSVLDLTWDQDSQGSFLSFSGPDGCSVVELFNC